MLSNLLWTSRSLAGHWERRVWPVQRHTELAAGAIDPQSPITIGPIIIRAHQPVLPQLA